MESCSARVTLFVLTRAVARTINKITFNWDVKDEQDPVYRALVHSMLGVDATCAAGAWLVDLIPQCQPSFRCAVTLSELCFQCDFCHHGYLAPASKPLRRSGKQCITIVLILSIMLEKRMRSRYVCNCIELEKQTITLVAF
jgi:hypothetical protein